LSKKNLFHQKIFVKYSHSESKCKTVIKSRFFINGSDSEALYKHGLKQKQVKKSIWNVCEVIFWKNPSRENRYFLIVARKNLSKKIKTDFLAVVGSD